MKFGIVLGFCILSLVLAVPLMAQDAGGTIEYGQTITGEITDAAFEVPYTFTGTGGDVIIIEMAEVEAFSDLSRPEVILLNSDGSVLGSSDSFGDVVFAMELPADGEYTIVATREDGRTGDSVGEFNLSLILPEVLTDGATIEGTVDNDSEVYYVYRATAPFALTYTKTSGDFAPEVTVNTIDDNGYPMDIAVLGGRQLTSGTIKVQPEADATFYVVNLSEALFDFNFNEVSANYIISVAPGE